MKKLVIFVICILLLFFTVACSETSIDDVLNYIEDNGIAEKIDNKGKISYTYTITKEIDNNNILYATIYSNSNKITFSYKHNVSETMYIITLITINNDLDPDIFIVNSDLYFSDGMFKNDSWNGEGIISKYDGTSFYLNMNGPDSPYFIESQDYIGNEINFILDNINDLFERLSVSPKIIGFEAY